MNIIVGTPHNATTQLKGGLLENLAGKLLEARGYKITHKQLRKAGCELDLICQMEANHSKIIHVECKAYDPGNKIQSDAIVRLRGLRGLEGYGEEMWLITTSDLGKDAEGMVSQISNSSERSFFTFITPKELIKALVQASIIKTADICKEEVESLVGDVRKVSEVFLLITEFGYFWGYEYMPQGTKEGYIFFDARSAKEITEGQLLDKLAEISQLDSNLDFSALLNLLDTDRASRLTADKVMLSPDYLRRIDSMKFKIIHSGKSELRNSDVFVYPDLNAIEDKKGKINAKDAIADNEAPKIIIFGDDLSGKTTLLQQYQIMIADSNNIPILIHAADINIKTVEAFNKLLTQKFKDQYNASAEYVKFFCTLLENHPEKITLLVDDLQNIGIKRAESQISLVAALIDRYPNIILAVHRSSELEILAKSEWKELLKDFSQFNITQFGHLKRDYLIEKWLAASESDLDDSEILHGKTDLAAKINIAVGKSFVPTYPFYLLTMLQMLESGSKSSIKGTAYGDLYSYLITNALGNAGVRQDDLDFYNTYLANLAYKLFEDDKSTMDLISIEKFYKDYLAKMYIDKDFSQVHRLLVRSRLLAEKDKGYSFQFNYVAHYFVAKYLSDNHAITKKRDWVNRLVKNLYKDKYANVVIFLIHHSKNTELIKAILAEARSLFEGVNVNMLTIDELTKFNSLLTEQISLTYKNLDPAENRKDELSYRDKLDGQKDTSDEEINEKLDLFGRIKYSFRLMEVLGQIANNYYGSLDGETKAEILQVLYDLGLRGMNALLQEYGEYIDGLRDEVKQTIIKKRAKATDPDKLASDIVYSFTQLIVFAFVKKASDSVMSKHLFPVIDRLPIEHEHLARHLITAAIKLNFPDELSVIKGSIVDLFDRLEKNYLPRDVLRFLVLNHLYKYKVSHSLKQSICENLEMKLAQPKTQLLT